MEPPPGLQMGLTQQSDVQMEDTKSPAKLSHSGDFRLDTCLECKEMSACQ